jgi:hypothetical protein
MRWRLLDRILAVEPWTAIAARRAVPLEQGLLALAQGLGTTAPPALLLAAHAELAGWLALASSGFAQAALPVEVEDWTCPVPPAVGDQLELTARLTGRDAAGFCVEVAATAGGAPIARGRLGCVLCSAADLMSAAEWERRWQELHTVR